MKEIFIREARTEKEIREAYSIREEVFVHEQGIFQGSDIDEHDSKSTHLVAGLDGQIIGTVRLYPEDGQTGTHWVGGRLAVVKPLRRFGVGRLLIQAAVRLAREWGATTFTAHIQAENVELFSSLGWRAVGPVQLHFGRWHQQMKAPTGRENS